MENKIQQNISAQEKKQSQKIEKKSLVCKKCNATLEEDDLFCPECGEKIDGEERICPICSCSSTSEFCPNCGYKLIPSICPKCGKESNEQFCENCGEILNEQLKANLAKKNQTSNVALKKASPEVAQKCLQDLNNRRKSAEENQFIKKMQEHKILMEERGYYNDREKRIIQKFGINIFGTRILDPTDTAYASKIYSELRKAMTERQAEIENEELKRLYPDVYKKYLDEEKYQLEKEEKYNAELNKKLKELEKKYKSVLETTTSEFNTSYENEQERLRKEEEERRRKEEERLRREMEEQRRREEEEERRREEEYRRMQQRQRERRLIGTYICQYDYHFIEIKEVNDGLAIGLYGTTAYDDIATFAGTVTGNSFRFTAREAIRGTPDSYIFGTLTGSGKLCEESGMCSEPLFFKF